MPQVAAGSFADLVRRHRVAAGLTQEALAERAGLSVHGIQNVERGVTRPYRDTVQRVLVALQLSVDEDAQLRVAARTAPRQRILAAASSERHNLPVPVTSFIGRERELVEVAQRLTHARLLTLTGVGGCGKTRLAVEVARTVLERYPDGVWLVELGPVADPTLVPHVVAVAVGAREGTDQSVTGALTCALRNRHVLLVLDNCEHLLEACACLADDLVRSCAYVDVLATSREALGLTGEIGWRVPSLLVPDAYRRLTLEELGANPSVQLFVERATASQPRFALTERNAPAVAQICRRLDGIPLALELAAARIRALTAEQVAARLDQRFRLLSGGSRTALPRQQTLRATLDWSYELLSRAEQLLFVRLSVFPGSWSLEAAEGVCADERIAQVDVLDLLAQLVSKSLVLADEDGDGAERFRMLETVREYARERLVASGEAEAVHHRHASHFLAFGGSVEPERINLGCTVAPTGDLLDQLEREQDNLRAALRWWIESDDPDRAIRQAAVLYQMWFWRGYLTEGQAWLEEILGIPSMLGNPPMRGHALPLLANLACRHADYVVAREGFEELLAAQKTVGDRLGAAYTLVQLANVHYLRAAYQEAWECLEAARLEAGNSGDREFENLWRIYGGMTALCEGRYQLARTLTSAVLTALESDGKPVTRAYCQMSLGTLDREEGRYREAKALFLKAVEVAWDFRDRTLLAHLLEGFSGLASALEDHQRAVHLAGAAAALRESAGAPLSPAWRQIAERWLAISRRALGDEGASAAWAAGRSVALEVAVQAARAGGAATSVTSPEAVIPYSSKRRNAS